MEKINRGRERMREQGYMFNGESHREDDQKYREKSYKVRKKQREQMYMSEKRE